MIDWFGLRAHQMMNTEEHLVQTANLFIIQQQTLLSIVEVFTK